MKRVLLIVAVGLVLTACVPAQTRYLSPVWVDWEPVAEVTYYEVGLEPVGGGEIVVVANTTDPEYYVDLEALAMLGEFWVMARTYLETTPDLFDYSDWCRSDNPAHAIRPDGAVQTFTVARAQPALMPSLLRVR